MPSRKILALAVAATVALFPAAFSRAQQSAAEKPAAASKVSGPEVNLPVSVRDKHGVPLSNLTASDFTLTDNGHAETIQRFAATAPLQIGLLVDTSRGMMRSMDPNRKAAQNFVKLVLPAESGSNQIFLIHFDREVELLEDFTSSRDKLNTDLASLGPTKAPENTQGPETTDSDAGYGGEMRRRERSPQLYDAIYLAADQLMKSRRGRKALIVFSNGIDQGSKETLNDAIDAAQRAQTPVYTIYFRSEEERFLGGNPSHRGGIGFPGGGGGYPGGYPGGNPYPGGGGGRGPSGPRVDGRRILSEIATRTGGVYYEARRTSDFEPIYNRIAQDLNAQYLLTYTPGQAASDGTFHKVLLKANKNDLEVAFPEGYYAAGGDNSQ